MEILFAWYLEIQIQALDAAVLHADETGWRVGGKTYWLWCFTTTDLTYYLIDRGRGRGVLKKFFKKQFAGILVSDFWGAYNAVACSAKQKCLPHLLREVKKVDHYHHPGGDWPLFAKQLRRLIRDSIRLRKRNNIAAVEFASRRRRLTLRLQELIDTPWTNTQARRLVKRLRRHAQELFTFLDHPEVPFDNNHAERTIRPAVIIRKNSYANGSTTRRGADLQAVLMSIYRTLKQSAATTPSRSLSRPSVPISKLDNYPHYRGKSLHTAKELPFFEFRYCFGFRNSHFGFCFRPQVSYLLPPSSRFLL